MADEEGFEPPEGLHLRRFSRPVHSTTLPLILIFCNDRILPYKINNNFILIGRDYICNPPLKPIATKYISTELCLEDLGLKCFTIEKFFFSLSNKSFSAPP